MRGPPGRPSRGLHQCTMNLCLDPIAGSHAKFQGSGVMEKRCPSPNHMLPWLPCAPCRVPITLTRVARG